MLLMLQATVENVFILGGVCSGLGAVVQGLFHVNVLLPMPVSYLIVVL